MKYAQSSAVYFNYSLPYAIQDLHELGYQGIEIWGGRPHIYRNDFDEKIDEIVSVLNQLDMKVCNFIPAQFRYPSVLCSENEHVRKESIEYIKSAMDNAVKVGSPTVSLCPGMTLFDEDLRIGWNQLVKSFEELAEYAKEKRLILLIEPAHQFETNHILTVEDGLRMIDTLGSNQFGILLDVGHAHLNGENFDDIFRQCQGIPLHIHIDDNHGDVDSHLIPGKGTIDFNKFFEVASKYKYDGFLSTELGTNYLMNPSVACKETLDFLKSFR
jgi:fructoselysine 3-epimerase